MKLRRNVVMTILVMVTAFTAGVFAYPPTTPRTPSPLIGPAKAVTDAKQKLDAAKAQMLVIRRKVELVFSAKPEWKTTKEALDRSKSDFDAEGRKVIADLSNVPAYKVLSTRRDKDQAIIDGPSDTKIASASDDTPKPTAEDVLNASKDRRDAVLAMKDMEKESQDADPKYATLKQKYLDARTAMDALEMQVDDAVKLDPGYDPAQKAIEAADSSYKQALASYAAAAKAQADAAAAAARSKSTPRR